MQSEALLKELVARIALVGDYGNVTCSDVGEPMCAHIHLADATVTIFLDERQGEVVAALSYLVKPGQEDLHLNLWMYSESDTNPVDALWKAFWIHEEENRSQGRITWMHGPDLPWAQVKPEIDALFDDFSKAPFSVLTCTSKKKIALKDEDLGDIFDLF